MQTFEWVIEDIVAAYPALSLDEDAAMAVALTRHAPAPCDFLVEVDGFDLADLGKEKRFVLRLIWNAETMTRAERIERTKQRTPIVERGAVAVAAQERSPARCSGRRTRLLVGAIAPCARDQRRGARPRLAAANSRETPTIAEELAGLGWVCHCLLFRGFPPRDTMEPSFATEVAYGHRKKRDGNQSA
jgi:hypothetical protein